MSTKLHTLYFNQINYCLVKFSALFNAYFLGGPMLAETPHEIYLKSSVSGCKTFLCIIFLFLEQTGLPFIVDILPINRVVNFR